MSSQGNYHDLGRFGKLVNSVIETNMTNLGRFGNTLPIASFAHSLGYATQTDPNSL
jgi:hypothetical protein